MNTTTPPPDGYCAWHPSAGWRISSLRETIDDSWKAFVQDKDLNKPEVQNFMAMSVRNGWTIKPVWFSTKAPMGEEEASERATIAANKLQPSGEGGFHPDPLWHEAYDIYMQAWHDMTGKL